MLQQQDGLPRGDASTAGETNACMPAGCTTWQRRPLGLRLATPHGSSPPPTMCVHALPPTRRIPPERPRSCPIGGSAVTLHEPAAAAAPPSAGWGRRKPVAWRRGQLAAAHSSLAPSSACPVHTRRSLSATILLSLCYYSALSHHAVGGFLKEQAASSGGGRGVAATQLVLGRVTNLLPLQLPKGAKHGPGKETSRFIHSFNACVV